MLESKLFKWHSLFCVFLPESVNVKKESRRKHNISFNIHDLNSFKRSANTHTWAYLIFIMKDGTTYPALHFHGGGSKALLKEMERFVHLKRYVTQSAGHCLQGWLGESEAV